MGRRLFSLALSETCPAAFRQRSPTEERGVQGCRRYWTTRPSLVCLWGVGQGQGTPLGKESLRVTGLPIRSVENVQGGTEWDILNF